MKHDVISSHLRDDDRILHPAIFTKKIFFDANYEVNIRIYGGLPTQAGKVYDLVACQVVYKREDLRVLIKLADDKKIPDPSAEVKATVDRLTAQEKGPFHLIRDAKTWCNLPFTKFDENAFTEIGMPLST